MWLREYCFKNHPILVGRNHYGKIIIIIGVDLMIEFEMMNSLTAIDI